MSCFLFLGVDIATNLWVALDNIAPGLYLPLIYTYRHVQS